jgi:SAM-dependent methyltransferase
MNDSWMSGNPYERFMGRWSHLIAQEFLAWMAIPPAQDWLDIGCGTGALTKLILENHAPQSTVSIDSSSEFIQFAQQTIPHPAATFKVGDAQDLPLETNAIDALVSGIMLNFVPQPKTAVSEMRRVVKPTGQIGIFVWDYADGMEMLRTFWDTAVSLDPAATPFDEGLRFPLCQQGQLETLVREAGLQQVEARPIEVPTIFKNFDDYWQPFLGNVGPAGSYVASLTPSAQQQLASKLRETLPIAPDHSITLSARAWAVKGIP